MKLKVLSINKLRKLSRKKKIIFFGAGTKLQWVLEQLKDFGLEDRIEYIVDNDQSKQGSFIELGKRIEVQSPEILKKLDLSRYIIIISIKKYESIFAQLQNLYEDKDLNVYWLLTIPYKSYEKIEKMIKLLPLKKYILIAYDGRTCDNTNALGKYIRDNGFFGSYKIIWLCYSNNKPQNTTNEKYIYADALTPSRTFLDGVEYLFYFGRAKYVIYENQPLDKFRIDQILVYLNHGAPPLKATKGIIVLPDTINYALSPSEFCSKLIREQFSVNEDRIVICGSPRTDVFFEAKNLEILQKLSCGMFNKVILWAPTFRKLSDSSRIDSTSEMLYGIPVLQNEKDWDELEKSLEKFNVLLLIKPHRLADLTSWEIEQSRNLKFMTQDTLDDLNINVYELMICTDALITDYSSIAFDYMLLDKPIGYTLDDMNEYKIGFSVPDPKALMPGHYIYNTNDLIAFLESVSNNRDDYSEFRNNIKQMVHNYTEGGNSKRLCDILKIGKGF